MEPRGALLPMYFVADESGSMGPYIHELNEGLVSLQDAMQVESFAAAKIRFSVIGFADDAVTYLEPADLRTLPHMPVFQARGLTSYQSAFDQIGYRISVDVPNLKAQGYQVHRPGSARSTPRPSSRWRRSRSSRS